MTSQITLYKDSKIIPSKNFVVEDIESYLSTLTKINILDFQYLRNDLKLTIKINRSQEFTESIFENNYNYVKVSQNSVNYYYFVLKKTQISQSTIALEMELDTLNTYRWGVAFSISPRTRVIREHKDRMTKSDLIGRAFLNAFIIPELTFEENELFYLEDSDGVMITCRSNMSQITFPDDENSIDFRPVDSSDSQRIENGFTPVVLIRVDNTRITLGNASIEVVSRKITRNIDYYSEGITPVLYKRELGVLVDKINTSWNLIYQNAVNEEDAIECLAVPSEPLDFVKPNSSSISITNVNDGEFLLIAPFNSVITTLTDNEGVKWSNSIGGSYPSFITTSVHTIGFTALQIRRAGSNLYIRKLGFAGSPSAGTITILGRRQYIGSEKLITSLTFEGDSVKYYKTTSAFNPSSIAVITSNGEFTSSGETKYSFTTLENIDRVNPKLIKIISIPYFTNDFILRDEDMTMSLEGDNWTFDTEDKNLRLTQLETKFVHTVESDIDNPLDIFRLLNVSVNTERLRNDFYESKIYHSDFYQPKFVYDSFGFIFKLETIDESRFEPSGRFTFEFIMTSTINSKFMFKFPEYVLKMSTEDYDNILPVSRNNEAPIYNSSYITYLRTAYRYDLKALQQKEALSIFGIFGDTARAGLGINAKTTLARGVSAGIGAISGIVNSIATINQNEWSMQSKLEQLKNQANSVSGSDDLDLLENYSGNKAKLCLYQVSDRMKTLLLDLFYYYGYTTDEIKVPDITTRYWFNFLSCELEMTGIDKNISEVSKENLIQRYRDGATFLHHHTDWDFEQLKENWETSLL